MRRFIRHRWVIAGASLALVLAFAAGAWAAGTGSTASDRASEAATADVAWCGPGRGLMGLGVPGRWGDMSKEFKEKLKQRRERMETRWDALAKLLREKMSSEDQKKFDQLIARIKEQRQAVLKAQEELRKTAEELRGLTDKYLAPDAGT